MKKILLLLELFYFKANCQTVTLINNPDSTNFGVIGNYIEFNNSMYFQYQKVSSTGKFQLAKYDNSVVTLIDNPDSGIGFSGDPIVFNNNLYYKD